MFTIDEESKEYFKDKVGAAQAVRVFFGGYGWGGPSMGLALDEPKEGDINYEVQEVPVIVDPFALKIIKDSGGLTIRSGPFGPVAELDDYQGRRCH